MVIMDATSNLRRARTKAHFSSRTERTLVKLEDLSLIFGSISEQLNDQFVQIYAPLEIEDEAKRRKVEDIVSELVTERLAALLKQPDQSWFATVDTGAD